MPFYIDETINERFCQAEVAVSKKQEEDIMAWYYVVTVSNCNIQLGSFIEEPEKAGFGKLRLKFYMQEPQVFACKIKKNANGYIIEGKGWSFTLKPYLHSVTDADVQGYLGGESGRYFIQTKLDPSQLPYEGWKLHITAASYPDYEELLGKLVPFLKQKGLFFKVVRPSQYAHFADLSNMQAGKFVTIYLNNSHEFMGLSEELQGLLGGSFGIPVAGELHLGGRIYARYGAFKGKTIYNPYTGQQVVDERGKVCPDWVMPITLNSLF